MAAPVSAATLFAAGAVRAFPNPASERVIIEHSVTGPLNYALFDQTGRVVRQGLAGTDRTEISLNQLPRGLYFLSLTNQTNIFTQKLVVE